MEKSQNKEISTQAKSAKPDSKASLPVKPVTVRLEDFKKNLDKTVAESELPPFLSVMVLREMLMVLNTIAEKEYAQDREAWEKACKEGETDGRHQ